MRVFWGISIKENSSTGVPKKYAMMTLKVDKWDITRASLVCLSSSIINGSTLKWNNIKKEI